MFAECFDGGDLVTFSLRCQQRARVDRFAVEQDRILTAQAAFIAELDPVKAKSAQGGQQSD